MTLSFFVGLPKRTCYTVKVCSCPIPWGEFYLIWNSVCQTWNCWHFDISTQLFVWILEIFFLLLLWRYRSLHSLFLYFCRVQEFPGQRRCCGFSGRQNQQVLSDLALLFAESSTSVRNRQRGRFLQWKVWWFQSDLRVEYIRIKAWCWPQGATRCWGFRLLGISLGNPQSSLKPMILKYALETYQKNSQNDYYRKH